MNFPSQTTEFTYYDGITYVAKDAAGFKSCVGCEFHKLDDCIAVPFCSPTYREDKRDIIWIKKEET